MPLHRITVHDHVLWVLLFLFFLPVLSTGQQLCDSQLTKQIIDALAQHTRNDSAAANAAVISRYPNQRVYLFMINEKAGSKKLPKNAVKIYFTNGNLLKSSLPCLFALSSDQGRIKTVHFTADESKPSWQEYSQVDNSFQTGLRIVDLPGYPDPKLLDIYYIFRADIYAPTPTTVPPKPAIQPQSTTIVHPETLYVKVPPRRFLNYRVISSGIVALGSFGWFLRERAQAKAKLDDYHSAVETAEVIKLRAEVEKSRTPRNIAGTISVVSGVTFAYFLAKDLFWPERKQELDCKERDTWDSNPKFHFGLQPSLNDNEVKITMCLNF